MKKFIKILYAIVMIVIGILSLMSVGYAFLLPEALVEKIGISKRVAIETGGVGAIVSGLMAFVSNWFNKKEKQVDDKIFTISDLVMTLVKRIEKLERNSIASDSNVMNEVKNLTREVKGLKEIKLSNPLIEKKTQEIIDSLEEVADGNEDVALEEITNEVIENKEE